MPVIKPRKLLVQRLYEQFVEAGFSWRVAKDMRSQPLLWVRPPLFTELELQGEPMQSYLAVSTPLDADLIADVYERFIAGYLYSKALHRANSNSAGWLSRALRVQHYDGRQLFASPRVKGEQRLAQHAQLVQTAALVAYNYDSHIEHGPSTCVAIVKRNGLQFGVRDGRLVSNFKRKARRDIPVRFLCHDSGLANMPRGSAERTAEGCLYDQLMLWTEEQMPRLGERGLVLRLGLRILWWRSPSMRVPGQLRLLAAYEHSRDALSEACEQARSYNTMDDPISVLKELFVPRFMKQAEFAELFGSPHQRVITPVSDRIRQKWDQVINSLDPGYEAEDFQQHGKGGEVARQEA